jgi:hypothetical protein
MSLHYWGLLQARSRVPEIVRTVRKLEQRKDLLERGLVLAKAGAFPAELHAHRFSRTKHYISSGYEHQRWDTWDTWDTWDNKRPNFFSLIELGLKSNSVWPDLGSYWRLFQADMSAENADARGSSPASSDFSASKRKATAVMYSATSAAEGNR